MDTFLTKTKTGGKLKFMQTQTPKCKHLYVQANLVGALSSTLAQEGKPFRV